MMTSTTQTHDAIEARFDKIGPVAGLIALFGAVGMAVGYFANPQMAMGSYMFSFIFWMTITLGFLGLTLLHHMIRPSWSVPLLRIFESGGGWPMLVTFAVLFLPIVMGMKILYPWLGPLDHQLEQKTWYLNVPGFLIRASAFFVVWIFLAWLMRRSTLRQDETKNFRLEEVRRTWGAVGFLITFITATFAFFDWTMSMEPHWYSSMYPTIALVGSGLGALSLAVLIFCVSSDKAPYDEVVSPHLLRDFGNMLFTLVMLWGYTNISQYIILWNGNVPETTAYYARRQSNWWNGIGLAMIIGQFFIPFFTLIAPRTKMRPLRLAKIAGWLFAFHILDIYQTVVPAVPLRPMTTRWQYSPMPVWTDLVAFVAIGAVWFLVFALQTRRAPLLPTYDNRLQEALVHAH